MKKSLLLILIISWISNLHAAVIEYDVYGVGPTIQNGILSCCKDSIQEYGQLQRQLRLGLTQDGEKLTKKLGDVQKLILQKINKLGDFSLIDISDVFYPQDRKNFITIDIVKADESYRLPPTVKRKIYPHLDKTEGLNQLYSLWKQYDEENINLIRMDKIDLKAKTCPVIHCTWGFDQKELKAYLPQFKTQSQKYKVQLVNIIEHSDNDDDRQIAILLLAHSEDYSALAHFLIKYTDDSSSVVRNNTMRVLSAILTKHAVKNLDINRIFQALDYPYLTDRNKAAAVLWQIVQKDSSTHSIVIQKTGATLIKLLKLKQPNNHDFAYLILKNLSHKNYGEYDYPKWELWVNTNKKNLS